MVESSSDVIQVLHVDDEPSLSEMVGTFLEREDDRITVQTATNAEIAQEILSESDIDCLISDYDMPGLNGIEFLSSVRKTHPDLPFILFTGKGSEEVASEAISAGVSDYLQKEGGTDHYEVLANRILNLVTQYRAEIELAEFISLREESEEYRDRLLELVSAENRSTNEMVQDLLSLGCERFGVENGHLVMIDRDHGRHTVISVAGSDIVQKGVSDLSDTFCRTTVESDGHQEIHDAVEQGWGDDPAYETYGLRCYLGSKLVLGDRLAGTVCFVDESPREEFSHHERMFFDMLVRWFNQILERQWLEEAATIYEVAQDAIFVVAVGDESEFTIERVNPAYETLTGLSSGEIYGQTPSELMGMEQGATIKKQYEECVRKREPLEYEEDLTFGDETRHWHTRLGPVIENGEVTKLVGVTRDITERHRHAEQLRALNERSGMLMTAASDEEIAEIGVEAAREVLGLDASAIHRYKPEKSGLVQIAATDTISDLIGEAPILRSENSMAWDAYEQGEARAFDDIRDNSDINNPETPIRSELHFPLGNHGIMLSGSPKPGAFDEHDFMLGKILAANITSALDQVAQTERLRSREEALTHQNERLEEFASVVAHDLRNPLNVAEGRLEFAREERDSEHLEAVDGALERIDDLIDNLLLFARDGQTFTDLERVDIANIAEGCWLNVKTGIATPVTNIDRTIYADKSRLKQVFENLFRNAVEHGGKDVRVTIGELVDGFYVEDNGPGIPERERGMVFDGGYSTKKQGTGFGLKIVTQIVESHDWQITVTESSAGGARFEITGVEFASE